MFHAVIVDRVRGEVTLFNDRYGMHRLCYHEAKDGFYFGAEAKAILAARPELRELDYRSLGEFASFSCVLEDRTIFKAIQVLPAASAWQFNNAELVNKGRYFEPREWEEQEAAFAGCILSGAPLDSGRYPVEVLRWSATDGTGDHWRLRYAAHSGLVIRLPRNLCLVTHLAARFENRKTSWSGVKVAGLCQQDASGDSGRRRIPYWVPGVRAAHCVAY